jgi:hypothetical protein
MKSKIVLFISFFSLLIFFDQGIFAQKKYKPGTETITTDSIIKTGLSVNDNDSLQYLKLRREFAYMNYIDSLLRKRSDVKSDTERIDPATGKIIKRKKHPEDHSAINKIINSYPVQLFFWALAIIFICFILYKIILKNGFFDKSAKNIDENDNESPVAGLDHFSKYDSLIAEAEVKNDYNLATRYLFLQMLAMLADKEIIAFSPEKTNRNYLRELAADDQNVFSYLSLRYEYTWYGKFLISKTKYLGLKNDFSIFTGKFKTV